MNGAKYQQRWSQGSRPRTEKKSEAKDSLSEDRPSRGQGQECLRPRPRTQSQIVSKKKKVFKIFFQVFSCKKRLLKFFFRRSTKFQPFKKSVALEPRTGQFSRTRGQGLQNVSSRPRTSLRTPPMNINHKNLNGS